MYVLNLIVLNFKIKNNDNVKKSSFSFFVIIMQITNVIFVKNILYIQLSVIIMIVIDILTLSVLLNIFARCMMKIYSADNTHFLKKLL
jgi:hypothetical protein